MEKRFELPELGYEYNSLEPFIDETTMKVHHDKHHQAYTDKFNEALEKHPELFKKKPEEIIKEIDTLPEDIKNAVRNQGGGYVNHAFFWKILKKNTEIKGKIKFAIDRKFGGVENFRKQFSDAAVGTFGSGWAWLVLNEKKELEIIKTQNQDSPLTIGKIPILTIDLWEHAYYLKYQNRRSEYVENFFNVINWKKAEENYKEALKVKTKPARAWDETADKIETGIAMTNLRANGIDSCLVKNRRKAKEKIMELIPEGSEVMNMTSETLEESGIAREMMSSKYNSVREKLMTMDRKTQMKEMQQLGTAPDYAVGSVHAVTEDGKLVIVSNTGSQLPAYAYGAGKVIFVIGTQKIVKDMNEATKRIYEYVLPLESERAKKAYGVERSYVNKILVINKEVNPERIFVIFVDETLGF